MQSIEPLSNQFGIPVETDDRLVEANLSTISYPDWLDRLRSTFEDFSLSFEGGESSSDATMRAMAAVEDAIQANDDPTVIATHGRLLTLILRHFDGRFGFLHWKNMTAPDVFKVTTSPGGSSVTRIWGSGQVYDRSI